ncbi:MAG: hypothetical protein V4805_02080, partial [Pseudomonadota bacterium]
MTRSRFTAFFATLMLSLAFAPVANSAGVNRPAPKLNPALLNLLFEGANTVSVNITGLDNGATLKLRNNGTDPLVITRNGAHTFSKSIAEGAPLAVTIDSLPRGQQCSVVRGAQTMLPTKVDNVFVHCTHVASASLAVAAEGSAPWSLAVLHGAAGIRNRAYPGIRYESRLGVVGGVFPYEFRVTGLKLGGNTVDSSGVNIDFRRGLIRWSPTTPGSYVLAIEVRDSNAAGAASVQQAFPIEVASSGFSFVSADGGIDANGRGSLAQPFKTVQYALSKTATTGLIYVRRGNYATGSFGLDSGTSVQLMAYPDEKVSLDFLNGGISYNDAIRLGRIEGFDFRNILQYGISLEGAGGGFVVRNNRFINGTEWDSPITENPSYIFLRGGDTSRHFGVMVQDNVFGPYVQKSSGGAAIKFFDAKDALVENNHIGSGIDNGIHDKDNTVNSTHRENVVLNSVGGMTEKGISVSAQWYVRGAQIHHNLLINSNIMIGGASDFNMENVFTHHNTISNGHIAFLWSAVDPASKVFRTHDNVFDNANMAPYLWIWSPDPLLPQMTFNHNLVQTTSALAMDFDWNASGA